jgi:hypothetical protein
MFFRLGHVQQELDEEVHVVEGVTFIRMWILER